MFFFSQNSDAFSFVRVAGANMQGDGAGVWVGVAGSPCVCLLAYTVHTHNLTPRPAPVLLQTMPCALHAQELRTACPVLPLPCPALPCSALPCPALPCPALPLLKCACSQGPQCADGCLPQPLSAQRRKRGASQRSVASASRQWVQPWFSPRGRQGKGNEGLGVGEVAQPKP